MTKQPDRLAGPRRDATSGIMWVCQSEGRWETEEGAYRIERYTENGRCPKPHPGCPGRQPHTYQRWAVYRIEDGSSRQLVSGLTTFKGATAWLARRVPR